MDINATLLGQMITFAIFVWFTMVYVWPVLQKVLHERQTKIAEGLYAAERGHKELELSKKEAVRELKEAHAKASQIVEQAHKQANLIIENAKQDANVARERILSLGEAELEQSKQQASVALKNEVVNLAILSAEKILRRSINEEDQKKFMDLLKEHKQ